MQVEYRLDASPPVVVPTSCGLMGKGEGDALRRALGKLSAASLRYDAARDRELMRGFSAMRMSATAFKQQMLLNCGVRLHASELGVLMQEWAVPSSEHSEPMLDCAAFRAAFRRLGKARAEREHAKRVRAAATRRSRGVLVAFAVASTADAAVAVTTGIAGLTTSITRSTGVKSISCQLGSDDGGRSDAPRRLSRGRARSAAAALGIPGGTAAASSDEAGRAGGAWAGGGGAADDIEPLPGDREPADSRRCGGRR